MNLLNILTPSKKKKSNKSATDRVIKMLKRRATKRVDDLFSLGNGNKSFVSVRSDVNNSVKDSAGSNVKEEVKNNIKYDVKDSIKYDVKNNYKCDVKDVKYDVKNNYKDNVKDSIVGSAKENGIERLDVKDSKENDIERNNNIERKNHFSSPLHTSKDKESKIKKIHSALKTLHLYNKTKKRNTLVKRLPFILEQSIGLKVCDKDVEDLVLSKNVGVKDGCVVWVSGVFVGLVGDSSGVDSSSVEGRVDDNDSTIDNDSNGVKGNDSTTDNNVNINTSTIDSNTNATDNTLSDVENTPTVKNILNEQLTVEQKYTKIMKRIKDREELRKYKFIESNKLIIRMDTLFKLKNKSIIAVDEIMKALNVVCLKGVEEFYSFESVGGRLYCVRR